MIDRETYAAYRFFKDNDGWSSPPGRAACALASARSEQLLETAVDLGVASVSWEYDDEPIETDDDPDYVARQFESNAWTGPYGCVVTINDEHAASLWGIVLDQWGTDDPYARCVAADLAAECEDELRQAIGDAADAREGVAFA